MRSWAFLYVWQQFVGANNALPGPEFKSWPKHCFRCMWLDFLWSTYEFVHRSSICGPNLLALSSQHIFNLFKVKLIWKQINCSWVIWQKSCFGRGMIWHEHNFCLNFLQLCLHIWKVESQVQDSPLSWVPSDGCARLTYSSFSSSRSCGWWWWPSSLLMVMMLIINRRDTNKQRERVIGCVVHMWVVQ